MKILIMGFTKIKYMPYMNFYLDNINTTENEVHLLYWNRDLKPEDVSAFANVTLHEFSCFQADDVSKLSKIGSFLKYRKFALKILSNEEFDFIIVLHSLTGVLIADKLKRKYAGKYIFDYRDSTYEGFAPFKKIVGSLVEHSYATFVSSDAFRRFLPEKQSSKIYTSHNLLSDSLLHRDEKEKYGIPSDKIRIAFWGFIRHEEINREIIKKLANDNRFELHYYGREQQTALNLKEYAAQLDAENIFFHGEYKPNDRYIFVRNTDLIHNIYKDNNTMLAMGNKYYDGIIFYIPQLCMKGSFMGEKCTENGIGLECDPYDSDFADAVFSFYKSLDKNDFCEKCDTELKKILCEYENGYKVVHKIVGN